MTVISIRAKWLTPRAERVVKCVVELPSGSIRPVISTSQIAWKLGELAAWAGSFRWRQILLTHLECCRPRPPRRGRNDGVPHCGGAAVRSEGRCRVGWPWRACRCRRPGGRRSRPARPARPRCRCSPVQPSANRTPLAPGRVDGSPGRLDQARRGGISVARRDGDALAVHLVRRGRGGGGPRSARPAGGPAPGPRRRAGRPRGRRAERHHPLGPGRHRRLHLRSVLPPPARGRPGRPGRPTGGTGPDGDGGGAAPPRRGAHPVRLPLATSPARPPCPARRPGCCSCRSPRRRR